MAKLFTNNLVLYIEGVATYLGFNLALGFSIIISGIVAAIFGTVLTIGLAISTAFRAVVCLCMPTLSLKSGMVECCRKLLVLLQNR